MQKWKRNLEQTWSAYCTQLHDICVYTRTHAPIQALYKCQHFYFRHHKNVRWWEEYFIGHDKCRKQTYLQQRLLCFMLMESLSLCTRNAWLGGKLEGIMNLWEKSCSLLIHNVLKAVVVYTQTIFQKFTWLFHVTVMRNIKWKEMCTVVMRKASSNDIFLLLFPFGKLHIYCETPAMIIKYRCTCCTVHAHGKCAIRSQLQSLCCELAII